MTNFGKPEQFRIFILHSSVRLLPVGLSLFFISFRSVGRYGTVEIYMGCPKKRTAAKLKRSSRLKRTSYLGTGEKFYNGVQKRGQTPISRII